MDEQDTSYNPYNYLPNQKIQYGCIGTGIAETGKTVRFMILAPILIIGALVVTVMVVKMVKK